MRSTGLKSQIPESATDVSVARRDADDDDNVNSPQQELSDFDDALDYDENETDGQFYRQGDNFIKIWDASAYVDCAAMPEDEWSDDYDRAAIEARSEYYLKAAEIKATSGYNPMLMRELLPSAEYADDMLPFCSDAASATYRISCMRRGLLRIGGVKLNLRKLKFMLIRRAVKVRITDSQIRKYAETRTDWISCKYCGRMEPGMASVREHEQSCRHLARDPTVIPLP